MKQIILAIALVGGLVLGSVGTVRADTIAGWDFSQYFSDGLLTVDGSLFSNTLDANYSSLDPTNNAGVESAAFGQASLDAGVVPTAGSLGSNIDGPVAGFGDNAFDSHSVLRAEGQAFTEYMGLTSKVAADVIFKADLSSVPNGGYGWSVSFAGKTLSGTSAVAVSMSTDGSSYSSFGSVNLDTTDAVYTLPLAAIGADVVYVRLGLDPSVGQPVIDNVAVQATFVPEPAMGVQLMTGLASLLVLAHRRS